MSDIWIRKMKTFFRRLDFDNDGVIHRKDFVHMAERFGDLAKFDPKQKDIARQSFDDVRDIQSYMYYSNYCVHSGIYLIFITVSSYRYPV